MRDIQTLSTFDIEAMVLGECSVLCKVLSILRGLYYLIPVENTKNCQCPLGVEGKINSA